jgi:leader peptidase (prepilin peptidase)/N-methyltransferase
MPYLQPIQLVASAALAGIMGAIAAEDFRHFRVPDALNLLAAIAGLVTVWLAARADGLEVWLAMLRAIARLALCGGALWLVREAFYRLRGVDGLGMGDVKLAAAAGLWIGPDLFALAVLFAAIGALAFVAARGFLDGAWPRDRKIPFAFYLAPAIWVCWFLAQLFPPL